MAAFLVDQHHRAAGAGVLGALAFVVGTKAVGEVIGAAGVERAVPAAEKIDHPLHG